MMQRMDVRIVLGLILVAVGFGLGSLRGGGSEPATQQSSETGATASAEEQPTIWTCSMHPQIQLPNPGKCPICGMDLIPQASSSAADDESEGPRMTMSIAAMKLAELQTSVVRRAQPQVEVRMVGKVEYDETRQRQIAAWVGGRIDRMYVDYTGVSIRAGDHLAWIYSPELVSAQEELLQAIRANEQLGQSNVGVLRDTAAKTVDATREKLRLLGLTSQQIRTIEETQKVEDHITITAPIDGVVIEKKAVEGDYVKTGAAIYEMADLSRLWVKMDAYEKDLMWLRYGQIVEFRTEAYPGEVTTGVITFIDPILNQRTRTAKVRVIIDNSDGLLKPGMFVRATVSANVASGGRVIDESLRGKWISPMHPEVVKNGPGSCDVCGMPLVKAEELGYVTVHTDDMDPLVIPTSAPLITGRRAIVYVRVPDAEHPTFEGRQVVLGPRAGDVYLVKSGLREGELVVTQGAFKVDSSLQISAKPSMMSPEGGAPAPGHNHGGMKMPAGDDAGHAAAEPIETPAAFREQLGEIVTAFMAVNDALAEDDFDGAKTMAQKLAKSLSAVDMGLLEGEAHMQWMGLVRDLEPATQKLVAASDLEEMRTRAPALTASLALGVKILGVVAADPIRQFHCPMALDGAGADWLQVGEKTKNPFYGTAMQGCGDLTSVLFKGDEE